MDSHLYGIQGAERECLGRIASGVESLERDKMTSEQASRLVVASLVIVSLTAVLGEVGTGKTPKPRLFIAGGILYLFLGLGSDFAPGVAGPMAVLVAIAVVLNQGPAAFAALSKKLGAK
jgi:hypothetical protein